MLSNLTYINNNFNNFNLCKNNILLLNTIIKNNNINLLILGESGCGKSTLINTILLKYYNVDNLKKIENNILYINNVKEQGITFYKFDVKNFCKSLCEINNKKKTIILDDMDILNDQNQQIFKIQIDTYINNVNFICSCSNLNKIDKNIISYMIPIYLNKIDYKYLKYITNIVCDNNNIVINDDIKNNIIKYSNNLIKVLLNNIQKYILLKNTDLIDSININNCNSILNNNLLLFIFNKYYLECIDKNIKNAYNILLNINNDGYSIIDILDYMYNYLKYLNNDIYSIEDFTKYKIIKIISNYILNLSNDEDTLILFFLTNDIINIL